MNKEEMMALKKTLGEIHTSGEDTIRMANCLNFLSRKITEVVKREEVERQMKEVLEKVPEEDEEPKEEA